MNKQLNPRQIKTIQNFWTWFQQNELSIFTAFVSSLNTEKVYHHLKRNLGYVSKRINFIFTNHPSDSRKIKLFITANGYKKLFPKMKELQEKIPKLEYITIQVYIIPLDPENPTLPNQIIEAIQNTKIKLEDYNTAKRKIILTTYYDEKMGQNSRKRREQLLNYFVLFTLGEVQYKRHIKEIKYEIAPQNTNGLLSLSELPEFIDYLAKINYSRKLKIFFE